MAHDELEQRLIAWRRDIHRHPEAGYDTVRTAALVADELRAMGYDVHRHDDINCVVADLGEEGRCVLLRADMDALRIQENSGHDFASVNDGIMHACGHDAHTAMLLGGAALLAADPPAGRVRLVFQSAEEGARPQDMIPRTSVDAEPGEMHFSGALPLVDAGVLDGVDTCFALHVSGEYDTGTLAVPAGPAMASTDVFEVTFVGRGGHAALPHLSADPIAMAARAVGELQYLATRTVDPLQPAVVSVGSIRGGDAPNAICDSVTISGTIRTHDAGVRAHLVAGVETTCRTIAELSGGRIEWLLQRGLPPLINDTATAEFAVDSLGAVLDTEVRLINTPLMGGEDFAYFAQRRPSAFCWLGVRNEAAGIVHNIHSPLFDVDEAALLVGARAHDAFARAYLAAGDDTAPATQTPTC